MRRIVVAATLAFAFVALTANEIPNADPPRAMAAQGSLQFSMRGPFVPDFMDPPECPTFEYPRIYVSGNVSVSEKGVEQRITGITYRLTSDATLSWLRPPAPFTCMVVDAPNIDWELEAPAGSTADLVDGGEPMLKLLTPDVEGDYRITLIACPD